MDDAALIAASHLPGPAANLALLHEVAGSAPAADLRRWTRHEHEFLAMIGAEGLGRLAAEGDDAAIGELRALASDPRWRVREGVAMGLQRLGDHDAQALLEVCRDWATGGPLEQRAAAAGIAEPRLLHDRAVAEAALDVLDTITASLPEDRRSDAFKALRKGLGYCWSVVVAAAPDAGRPRLERWVRAAAGDRDVRWIVKENLRKNRLVRMDPGWVEAMRALVA